MFKTIMNVLTGGVVDSLEKVALEWIDTPGEKAEAKAIMVKALDPNGKMRRELSRFASRAYGFYLVALTVLIFMSVWKVGGVTCTPAVEEALQVCTANADLAASRMADLFVPITTSWALIVSASFGVNATNSIKGR